MPLRRTLSQFRCFGVVLGLALLLPFSPARAQFDEPNGQGPSFNGSAPPASSAPVLDDVLAVQELVPALESHPTIDLTVRTPNLWDRIRNGFAMTNLNDDLVLHYQQWYQNRPDALRRMVERSRPYLFHIVEELEARGMPTELALLPMVESAFNPHAYSRAHASGLWQFIPATGKRFNLEQNWWRDERRDVIASTGAALDYLQIIYDMHGDWHLALASYNWGEGAVKRAVSKNEARGLPTDYPSLTMPNETRHYVPKLQALKNILGDPALTLRLGLPDIANRPYFVTLDAPQPIDVRTAARLANMSLEEFQRLNPSHNRPVIKANTPVVIPNDKLDHFRSNLENADGPLTQWQAYTLSAPERLNQIADRFDTTAGELARVNGLSEKVRLGAGSTLLVPGGGGGLHSILDADEPRLIIAPEPVVCRKVRRKDGRGSSLACGPGPAVEGGPLIPSRHKSPLIERPTKTAKSVPKAGKPATGKSPVKVSTPAGGKAKNVAKPVVAPRNPKPAEKRHR